MNAACNKTSQKVSVTVYVCKNEMALYNALIHHILYFHVEVHFDIPPWLQYILDYRAAMI